QLDQLGQLLKLLLSGPKRCIKATEGESDEIIAVVCILVE
ncbi:MAG: hypothetical protein UT11_C0026G0001, partial [Berkelbacteria bacterium GW2011_GWA2_38_9]